VPRISIPTAGSRSGLSSEPMGCAGGRHRVPRHSRLRLHLARERGVPAYLIFNDATLLEMAVRKPKTEADLLQVPGVGPAKLEKYGEAFLKLFK